jgi:hypothetical protein
MPTLRSLSFGFVSVQMGVGAPQNFRFDLDWSRYARRDGR